MNENENIINSQTIHDRNSTSLIKAVVNAFFYTVYSYILHYTSVNSKYWWYTICKKVETKNSGKLKGTIGAIEDRILQNKGGHH